MNRLELKINRNCGVYKAGETVKVEADANGIPYDRFWRKRLRDATIDNCVSVVKPVVKPTAPAAAKKNLAKSDED